MKSTASLLSGSALKSIERRIVRDFRSRPSGCGLNTAIRQDIWKPERFARTFANGKQPAHKRSRKEELEDQARRLNKKGTELREENNPNSSVKEGQIDDSIAGEFTQKQAKTPWHREGADMAPVERMEDPPKEMAKGTPRRVRNTLHHTNRSV